MLTHVATVERREWTRKRIAFLEELLHSELSDQQRSAAEAELAQLKTQRRGVLGWLFPVRLPHQR